MNLIMQAFKPGWRPSSFFMGAVLALSLVAGPSIAAEGDIKQAIELYRKGDYAAAFRQVRPMAEAGNIDAQFQLGVMYGNGHGVEKDPVKATQWFDKAIAGLDPGAPFNIGVMYHEGQGLPKDYAMAAQWFRKSAERGDGEAQFNLALMYDQGRGVPKDLAEAAKWYLKAADSGLPRAQSNLAVMYQEGQGVEKDPVQAYKWFHAAAARGEKEAKKARDDLAKTMTSAQFSEALRLVHEWELQTEEMKEKSAAVESMSVEE
jgi:TPR repeat protein